MENILSRESLIQNAAKLVNTTPEAFSQYLAWKNSVLERKENIFPILQSFITEEYEPQVQIFILDIITYFINTYSSNLPLFEIQKSLFEITDAIVAEPYCVYKVGETIALILRLIYQNEKNFILEINEEKTEMNLLECDVFCSLCRVFDEPRHDISQDDNISTQIFFMNGPLIQYTNFAVRTLGSNQELSLKLLIACLEFRIGKTMQLNRQTFFSYKPEFIQQLLDNNLFDNLMSIVRDAPPEIGAEAIKAVMYIASSSTGRNYEEIMEGTIRFIGFILDSPAFFDEPTRVASFGNLMATTKICTVELLHQLIAFFLNLISHNFIIASNILEPCLDCYVNFTFTTKDDSIVEHFSSVLEQYVTCGLASFESNTEETYNALFDNRQQTSQTIDNLLLRSNSACINAATNIASILTGIASQPFTLVTNCQMGFLLQIARSAINNYNIFMQLSQQAAYTSDNQKPNFLLPLIDGVLNVLNTTQEHVLEYNELIKSEGAPFPFEISMVEFIRDYLMKLFAQTKISAFSVIPFFPNMNEMISVAFMRMWNDLLNDVESKEISRIFKTLDSMKIFDALLETEIPGQMLENYMEYPAKSIIFDAVCSVMSLNPSLRDAFFTSIKENFADDVEDPELLKKLFKIFKGLFAVTKEANAWRDLYIFFSDHYSSVALRADTKVHGKSILKLLATILSTKFPQQPFKSRTPYQFHLFHFVTQMLEKLSIDLVTDLSELSTVNTLFNGKLSGSNAISLQEAHTMKRSDQVDYDQISLSSDAWDIATFIVSTLNKLMISPFPNFGIISYYEDNSHFRIIDIIMERISYNSPQRALQLLSIPRLVPEILRFYSACLEFINTESIEEAHIERILTFSRAALVSNDIQIIQAACKTLLLLVDKIGDPSALAPHAILSFGILLNNTQDDALDFVAKYTSFNNELLPSVAEKIAENLPEQQSSEFNELFSNVTHELIPPTDKKYCQVVVSRLRDFIESVQEMNIHISQFPEFAQYFVFDATQ